MKAESDTLTQTGIVISKMANPCFLSISVLALMALTYSVNVTLLASWITSLIIFLILLPGLYVLARAYKEYDISNLLSSPTAFLKKHPRDVIVIASLFGLSGYFCLFLLDAPSIMLYTYATLLTGSMIIALLNMFYRVSYHLGAVTILVIMASVAWSQNLLFLIIALPIIGWAKHRIKEHTLVQIIGGIAIAVVISGVVLLLFH